MRSIEQYKAVLNSKFICAKKSLEEPSQGMFIPIDTNGCNSIIFQFDTKLDKSYAGGIFPFFNNGVKGVCKVCDYIIFSESKGKMFAIVIELKKGNSSTQPQLNAGVCFSSYLNDTVNRVYKKNIELNARKVSIHEFNRKGLTKIKDVEYNSDNTHMFKARTFRLKPFLK